MSRPIETALQTHWPTILVGLERERMFEDLHNLFMCTSVIIPRASDGATYRIPIYTNLAVTREELEHSHPAANQAFLAYAFNNILSDVRVVLQSDAERYLTIMDETGNPVARRVDVMPWGSTWQWSQITTNIAAIPLPSPTTMRDEIIATYRSTGIAVRRGQDRFIAGIDPFL